MNIKTKYEEGDIIYFLSTNSEDVGSSFDSNLKTGEVFICEAVVMKIKITIINNIVNIYNVVCTSVTDNWHDIHENFCAPDIVQLGVNVSNNYRVVAKPKKSKKSK